MGNAAAEHFHIHMTVLQHFLFYDGLLDHIKFFSDLHCFYRLLHNDYI